MRASRENAKPSFMRRALACLVSAAMVVAFTPVVAWGEDGDKYLAWDDTNKKLVEANFPTSYTEVTGSDTSWGTSGIETWYVASGPVEIGSRVTINGNVHLILADGCKLTVNGCIEVYDDSLITPGSPNSLTIYAQSTGGSMGKLTVQNVEAYNAGIGGNGGVNKEAGTITINGGAITATGGSNGAGIGGGSNGTGGTITINGGTVEAEGKNGGAGIGGGSGGICNSITINGGAVTATGGDKGGAGIGGGKIGGNSDLVPVNSNITINGGAVTATGGSDNDGSGAGIGGGSGGAGVTIAISGGTVKATSNGGGAGIGGGNGGHGGNVTINGGTVEASSNTGAGIGCFIGGNNQGTFSTGANGNAVIFASSITSPQSPISDTSGKADELNPWSGVIFENGQGAVYGSSAESPVVPTSDFTIPEDKRLTIGIGKSLKIEQGVTLTNEGAITIEDGGTLTNNGTIINKGTITGTVSGSQPVIPTAYRYYDAGSSSWKTGNQNCVEITAYLAASSNKTLGEGWYVVNTPSNDSKQISGDITFNGNVRLILADNCKLTVNGSIYGGTASSLTIYGQSGGTGELHVTNTITGGTGKGVEGGDGNGGNITINGGMVEAATISGGNGSHSPEGNCGNGGNVTINGGAVTATGSISGGTGGSSESARGTGGDVIISGGMVEAATISGGNGGSNAFGYGPSGSFKTQEKNSSSGNAVIFASSIFDQSGKDNGTWSGVIFEKNDGKVYGSSVTPTESFTVPSGATLTVPESATLAIASGKTLTNNGTIYVDGTLTGKVEGTGAVCYLLTLDADGGAVDTANSGIVDYSGKTYYSSKTDTALPTPTKSGYTFAGWYDDNTKVEQIAKGSTGTLDLIAKWNAIYVPPSDPSYNLPAAGGGGVAVKVAVRGSTAVVAEISASALESAAGSGAATVTIDLSGLPKGTTQAQLSKSTVDKLLAVLNDKDNAVESVTVNLGSAVLTLDAKALAAVAGQVTGANVTLGVKESSADALNSAQKKALSPFEVVQLYFEAQVKSGGAEIHDFGGGTVRVSVAFEPRPGHDPARYVVLYVGEDGAIERYGCAWAAGMLSFMAPHFSAYAVVYVEDATQAAIDALTALPEAGELKASQAKEAVKKAEDALVRHAALDDGQKMLVDEALVANAESVIVSGSALIVKADKKAVGKVKSKAFSVKAGKSKSIAFKTLVSAAGTKVVYKKASGSKYISVSKTGKVTAKKGMKKGKKYTAKVKVTCGKSYKTVAITVRAK